MFPVGLFPVGIVIVCTDPGEAVRKIDIEGDKPKRQKFKRYPIGFFHIDIAEVQTAEGKLYLFVGIDRTSKFAFTQLVGKAGKMAAAQFLRNLIAAVPYRVVSRRWWKLCGGVISG